MNIINYDLVEQIESVPFTDMDQAIDHAGSAYYVVPVGGEHEFEERFWDIFEIRDVAQSGKVHYTPLDANYCGNCNALSARSAHYFIECAYCGMESLCDGEEVPAQDDDTAWEQAADNHSEDCVWLRTRSRLDE